MRSRGSSHRGLSGHRGYHLMTACVLAMLVMSGAARGSAYRDDLGRVVNVVQSPKRLVTVLPSLTEIVCALDECSRLVGTDSYSNWPASVRALPKVGGLDDASIEAIAALHPDLVLLSGAERTVERLEALGIRTFVIETQTFADVARNVERIAALLGVPAKGVALRQKIADDVQRTVAIEAPARGVPGPRVYFEIDSTPYAAGPDSFIGELLTRLGAANIVTRDLGPFPRLNPEYIVRQNPDVMMVLPSEIARIADRPGWNTIRAVREHRVCVFSVADRDVVTRPGPRLADALRILGECLRRVSP